MRVRAADQGLDELLLNLGRQGLRAAALRRRLRLAGDEAPDGGLRHAVLERKLAHALVALLVLRQDGLAQQRPLDFRRGKGCGLAGGPAATLGRGGSVKGEKS